MVFYWLIVGVLSVWRVTPLLYGEDGPGDVFVRLRRLAGQSFLGAVLDCYYCLSVWIAVPFALLLGESWKERGLLVLALSAGRTKRGPRPAPERCWPVSHVRETTQRP